MTTAIIHTNHGAIELELYPDDAPKTAIDGFFIGLSKRSIEAR